MVVTRASSIRRAVPLLLLGLVLLPVLRIASAARLVEADLTYNNGTEVTTLDPGTVTGIPEGRVLRALFEGLFVKHPRTLEPLPGMATGYEVSEDGRTYVFTLRPDARWSNGDPVTAHDFVWSWRRLLEPETAAEYAYQLWYVRGARELSRLPTDRLYGADPRAGWAREVAPGRWRLGASGLVLAEADPGAPLELAVGVGDVLAAGDALFRVGGTAHAAPIGGRVAAVNAALGTTAGEANADPYHAGDADGSGWMVELAVNAADVERRLAAGALLEGPAFRDLFFEREVGIRAEGDLRLVVELASPTAYFIQLTSFYPLFPVNRRSLEEARERWPDTWDQRWVRPENLVTNGPYRLVERRVNDRIRLVKSETYWDADSVALDSIDVLAVENYATMLNLYLTGGVAWIDRISTNQVHRLVRREDFDPVPYLGSYFYRVNVTRPPFDDPRVRRALALSIDRRAICEKILKAGQRPAWSVVPPGMAGYPEVEMEHAPVGLDLAGYEEALRADVERARALLAEAGYGPGGERFPTFEIHYNTSEAHRDIAEVVAADWKKHLGIDARLLNQEWKVYLDAQSNLRFDVSRSAWIGDYVDPNTFLDLFVTGGENNRTGWGSAEYDELVRRAALELDPKERLALLSRAERLLLEELPVLPIYYYVTQSMYNPRLGGFHDNILDEHFPKVWYWKSDAELAADRARDPGGEVVPAPGPRAGKYAPNHVPGRWD